MAGRGGGRIRVGPEAWEGGVPEAAKVIEAAAIARAPLLRVLVTGVDSF
jgi:hypothetical protein